jgi:hypothetical protein
MEHRPDKKVVRVGPDTADPGAAPQVGSTPTGPTGGSTWKPTSEAKSQANTARIVALVLWVLAIAIELFAIFWVLKQHSVNMILLIVAIVLMGVLAIAGDVLWKRANRLDPASTAEPVRFFVQNQLGAIIAIVAFLPLIVMIFLNKNMTAQQKGVAGSIGVVVFAVAGIMGISFNPPSVEQNTQVAAQQSGQPSLQQYPAESAVVIADTGQDLVFWTKDGTVYHLCQAASALQHESKDNTIYSGPVADAHAAGKDRLTLQVAEELKQCGFASPVPSGS